MEKSIVNEQVNDRAVGVVERTRAAEGPAGVEKGQRDTRKDTRGTRDRKDR